MEFHKKGKRNPITGGALHWNCHWNYPITYRIKFKLTWNGRPFTVLYIQPHLPLLPPLYSSHNECLSVLPCDNSWGISMVLSVCISHVIRHVRIVWYCDYWCIFPFPASPSNDFKLDWNFSPKMEPEK